MDELFMQRCFELARLGAGQVSPNPNVGAVLVHEGRIIGEGWHQQYGKAHAEVNAIDSVKEEDRHLIEHSTLYVSLEPCCIFGKTPPCTDLILRHRIKRVVISCLDQTPEVSGKGVSLLKNQGIDVTTGLLQAEGEQLSAIRNTFITQQRPYINLKFAKSRDGFMGQPGRQVWISNDFSRRLAHKWRSEFDAILIGTNTALIDKPQLTNRFWYGQSPFRIVLDKKLVVGADVLIGDVRSPVLVVTESDPTNKLPGVEYLKLTFDENMLQNLLHHLYERRITSLIVEGGAATINHFIRQGLWDEATVFTAESTYLTSGIQAPVLPMAPEQVFRLGSDSLALFRNAAAGR